MMRDWKTTAFGLIAALAAFVQYAPQYFPGILQDFSGFIMIGGLAGLGITAAQVRRNQAKPPIQDPPRS